MPSSYRRRGTPIAYDWYRGFLELLLQNEAHQPFAFLVAYGEVLVGIGLILGAFTGIAAFFGAVMNWNFMLAGTTGANPVLGLLAIGVIIAWKTAGWWGLDRFILPYVGAPWSKGRLFGGHVRVGELAQQRGHWVRSLVAASIALLALIFLDGPAQVLAFLATPIGLAVFMFLDKRSVR